MGAERGIAGSHRPEQEGIFLCESEFDVDWFVRMNNTGAPVDVWALDGISEDDLVESPEGYRYLPTPVPPERLSLVRMDVTSEGD